MNTRIKTILLCSIIGIIIAAGCNKKDGPTGPQTSGPVGTWKGALPGDTMAIVVKADSSFTMDIIRTTGMSGRYLKIGTCAVSGDTITFTSAPCYQLNYRVDSLSGNTLIDSLGTPCMGPDIGILSGSRMTMPIPYGDETTVTLTKK